MKNKKNIPELSKAEYNILRILWNHGELTVREVHDRIQGIHNWAYSTTKTMMDRMTKKKLLKRDNFHGIFIYKPLLTRPVGLAKFVHFFANRILETDVSAVVSMFAESNALSEKEITELEKLLEEEFE